MFGYRRQRRLWAAQVLLLWLFGIGTGFANACLTAPGPEAFATRSAHAGHRPEVRAEAPAPADVGAQLGAQLGAQSGAHHAAHASPHHHAVDGDDSGAQHASGKSNCQDFCDKASVTIAPLKSALDAAQGQALPPPAAAPGFAVAPVSPVALPLLPPRRDGGHAVPMAIAFLRLTL
jgi:hypothetical protein